jgi:hypothetical protein
MRKLIMVTITLVVFGAGWCLGQQKEKSSGGIAWKATSDYERQLYVIGFKDGYIQGMSNTWAKASQDYNDKKVLAKLTPTQRQGLEANAREGELVFWPLHNSSARVLSAAVTDFYDDQENLSVCWERAVTLAAISLSPMKPTQEELATAREKGAQGGCR